MSVTQRVRAAVMRFPLQNACVCHAHNRIEPMGNEFVSHTSGISLGTKGANHMSPTVMSTEDRAVQNCSSEPPRTHSNL